MSEIPPGWYDDGSGAQRYWNGAAWTEQVVGQAPAFAAAPGQPVASGRKRRLWPWLLGGGVLLLVIAGAIVGFGYLGVNALVNASAGPKAAVMDFDEAWKTGDCALFMSSTTSSYREDSAMTTCEAFTDTVNYDTAYVTQIDSFFTTNDESVVNTTESFIDEDGEKSVSHFTYRLLSADGQWKIDSIN